MRFRGRVKQLATHLGVESVKRRGNTDGVKKKVGKYRTPTNSSSNLYAQECYIFLIYMPAKPVACAILHSTGNNLSLWLILNWKGLKQHVPLQVHTRRAISTNSLCLPNSTSDTYTLSSQTVYQSFCLRFLPSVSHTHTRYSAEKRY